VTLRLPYRPPFDWDGILAFLRMRAIPGVEAVDADGYRRVIEIDDSVGFIEVGHDREHAQLSLQVRISSPTELARCVERTRRLFDLGANPQQIASDLSRDPDLRDRLEAKPGVRVPGAWDPFELTVRAVLGQQVSVRGATTLSGRLVRSFGKPIDSATVPFLTHVFPRPEVLAEADVASIGLPRARGAAIRELGRRVARGELDFSGAGNVETVMSRMREIPGIGDWTAQYVAMRALADSDAFPSADLGLIRALSKGKQQLTPVALRKRAEAWRPWRAYAAMCLWGS
jgi:AraC family transcriptional regulator of adaptative response / DNA-3-methyladenine glycosylase II